MSVRAHANVEVRETERGAENSTLNQLHLVFDLSAIKAIFLQLISISVSTIISL
jgi:hypothetical protein